jgi:hypothetical protein
LPLLFDGNKPPFGAFHDHRCFPFLTLRWPRPALGYHRYPIRRVDRVRGGHTFPKIDADERTTIRRDPIILADQTGDSFIVWAVALIVSINWALDVPAGTLNVHITVCITHLPHVGFQNH